MAWKGRAGACAVEGVIAAIGREEVRSMACAWGFVALRQSAHWSAARQLRSASSTAGQRGSLGAGAE